MRKGTEFQKESILVRVVHQIRVQKNVIKNRSRFKRDLQIIQVLSREFREFSRTNKKIRVICEIRG